MLWVDADTLLVTSDVYPDCGRTDAGGGDGARRRRTPASLRPRASTTGFSTATGTRGRTAGAPTCWWSRSTAATARDLTPGTRDVPAVQPGRTRRLRGLAGRARRSASRATTIPFRRSPPTPSCGWCPRRAAPRARSPGSPGYDGSPQYSPDGTPHRVPRAAARGLRGGPLAAHGLRPQERAPCAQPDRGFDRQVDAFAWSHGLEDALLRRQRRRTRSALRRSGGGRAGRTLADGSFGDVLAVSRRARGWSSRVRAHAPDRVLPAERRRQRPDAPDAGQRRVAAPASA